MGTPLLQGPTRNGLYLFPPPASPSSDHFALIGEWITLAQWHHRLSHLTLRLVYQILRTKCLPFLPSQLDFFCSSCPLAKCRQLPFKNSVNWSSRPLNLIFVDVWGPSPYLSRTVSITIFLL